MTHTLLSSVKHSFPSVPLICAYRVVRQQSGIVIQNKPAVLPPFHNISPFAERALHDRRHLYFTWLRFRGEEQWAEKTPLLRHRRTARVVWWVDELSHIISYHIIITSVSYQVRGLDHSYYKQRCCGDGYLFWPHYIVIWSLSETIETSYTG